MAVTKVCRFAQPCGKALKCLSKSHYKDVCFFQYYCYLKHKPLNTGDFESCPILQKEATQDGQQTD